MYKSKTNDETIAWFIAKHIRVTGKSKESFSDVCKKFLSYIPPEERASWTHSIISRRLAKHLPDDVRNHRSTGGKRYLMNVCLVGEGFIDNSPPPPVRGWGKPFAERPRAYIHHPEIGEFVAECIDIVPGAEMRFGQFCDAFREWLHTDYMYSDLPNKWCTNSAISRFLPLNLYVRRRAAGRRFLVNGRLREGAQP